MTQDMRQIIRTIIVVVSLVMGAAGQVWALTENDIIINKIPANIPKADGSETVVGGTVTKSLSGRTVTLTVTPESGYYIKKNMITVEKMVAPTRSTDSESLLSNTLPHSSISGSDGEESTETVYSFTLPNDWEGAYVTVRFYQKTTGFTQIFSLSEITDFTATGRYELVCDVDASGWTTKTSFSGELTAQPKADGTFPVIMNLGCPLFTTVTDAKISNIILDNVGISVSTSNTNVGAIASTANGATRIYNCGILSGSVGGTRYVGGIVGFLDGTARVINCYSYATITGGSTVAGIVGYNNVASSQSNVATMVMNCMFYGDITGGSTVSPVYGGKNINNKNSGGLTTYNYYAYSRLKGKTIADANYNCALAIEDRFLNRCELYRQLLNSNKKLAAKYATGSADNAEKKMAKWVLETADKSIVGRDPYPYPVLKAQGNFPSIINYDVEHAPDSAAVGRNKGGKVGTLSVTISGVGTNHPDGAKLIGENGQEVSNRTLTIIRTDKDEDRFNFNYDKIQLPYYNDVGTGNYTGNRVVTGWKITAVSGGRPGTFTEEDAFGGYNFADRKCTQKDIFSVSGRVFSQGAYYDVPYGVTGITIEPYWGVAAYVSDEYYDYVYKKYGSDGKGNYVSEEVTILGTQSTNDSDIDIYGDGNTQKVFTSIDNARASMNIPTSGKTVYDYAVVLVGNVHQAGPLYGDAAETDNTPYTIMSVDLDKDNESDYSFIFSHYNRQFVTSIRFDFLNVIGTAQAQKPSGEQQMLNVGIFNPRGWFEVTNTCQMYIVQFESQNEKELTVNGVKVKYEKSPAPVIFLGGVVDQYTSTQDTNVSANNVSKTQYIHLGSNAWFKDFGNGTHSDGYFFTYHVPVSVTGGDFEGFYLSGVYRPDAQIKADNAEGYISGGRFKEMAGASQQMIWGDVKWQIYNADITNFYGGGVNADRPITGDVTVDIFNSHVTTYCGGPKFGDMQEKGKSLSIKYSKNKDGTSIGTQTINISKNGIVTTNAIGCTFGKFFGAGYGGASSFKLKFYDSTNPDFDTLEDYYTGGSGDRGKYYDGINADYKSSYGNKGPGVATDFDYEFFVWSSGSVGARFYVNYTTLSLAKTNDVRSNLTKCVVNDNFYGGGSLGVVAGKATSVLDGCTVNGSVFGGGFSASIPTVPIRNSGFKKSPKFNKYSGMFEMGEKSDSTEFKWTPGEYTVNEKAINETNYTINTNANLTILGQVDETDLTVKNNTTVLGSVYGGGEESGVGGNTTVSVTGGTIGTAGLGGAEYGNVYGGGKGKEDNVTAGLVKGNTTVTISGSPRIYHNIYGGGAFGSVGNFVYDGDNIASYTDGGKCTVTVTGGDIGSTGKENGMVFGSSRGAEGDPAENSLIDNMAWVHDTEVVIGSSSDENSNPLIRGSVYGGGENGHNYGDAVVTVHSGTIGIDAANDSDGGARYPYRGNVYGGGCGTDTYDKTVEVDGVAKTLTYYNFKAGIVQGNATVNVDGGHVVHNVYGAGAMGSVGTFTFLEEANTDYRTAHPEVPLGKPISCAEGTGKCTVTISGGRIGKAGMRMTAQGGPDDYGHVFGAGRGEANDSTVYANLRLVGFVDQTLLTIKDNAFVYGSVYGGSESGHVLHDTWVKIAGGQIGDNSGEGGHTAHWPYEANGAPYDQYADADGNYPAGSDVTSSEGGLPSATDGHTFYGNVFGGGSGYYPYAPGKWMRSAGWVEGDTKVEITGGRILNNVYGGCEMADVNGSTTVEMSGGTVGVSRDEEHILANPTFGHVFGAGMGDKRIFFNTSTNVASTSVCITGGTVYGSVYGGGEDGHVLGNAMTTISQAENKTTVIGSVGTSRGYDGNVFGGGQGSSTALTAGVVGGNVTLNVQGGEMKGSVYGGGRIASVGTYFAMAKIKDETTGEESDNPDYGKMQDGDGHGCITINLTGGIIDQDVYGGCMGTTENELLGESKNVTVKLNEGVAETEDKKGCVVKGSIFGCNNVNSSPLGNVLVHVYATQRYGKDAVTDKVPGTDQNGEFDLSTFDVKAVYGGGNMAAYKPTNSELAYNETNKATLDALHTNVIIDGCGLTSIGQVYGGGNAASTPATNVEVNGTYEIGELFGGGNGKGRISLNFGVSYIDNPGANVGFYDYHEVETTYDTKDKRQQEAFKSEYVYGSGKAAVNINGGKIHRVFGGSNTKGNVRITAVTMLEEVMTTDGDNEVPVCSLVIYEAYGGGKSAPMDAEAILHMACIPGLKVAYGGAEAADIQGNVTLNITNGTFDRVFGGNNKSGTIRGAIKVNIEETGCRPVIIGELYGGGNEAGYSIYGYKQKSETVTETVTDPETGESTQQIKTVYKWVPIEDPTEEGALTGDDIYADPEVNVRSFTSIGEIYGGGLGETAVMVGSPTVNINVAKGDQTNHDDAEISEAKNNMTTNGGYPIPTHEKGKIGAINNVFGGGNAAKVIGNTNVNIGTEATVTYETKEDDSSTTEVDESQPAVVGADIRGNVYGGGNNAEVTGSTNVTIGKKQETTTSTTP